MAKKKSKPARGKKAVAGKTNKGPKQAPLIEGMRYDDLDAFCEAIGDARDRQARALADENAEHDGAQAALIKHKREVYTHAGIELALIPGTPKLRVRKVKADRKKTAAGDE